MNGLISHVAKEFVWRCRRFNNLVQDYRLGLALREYYRFGYRTMKGPNDMQFKLRLNLRDRSISRTLLQDGWWDPNSSEFMLSHVKEGMIAVDVGANVGFFTMLMSKLVGETGKVYTFEPEITNFSVLQESIMINSAKNIEAKNIAIGKSDGWIDFYIPLEHTNGRAYKSEGEEWRQAIRREVSLRRLDSILNLGVDVLKVDTEGMDLDVLEGLEGIMGDKLILVIEVWPSTYSGVINWLKEHEFSIVSEDQLSKDKQFANIHALRGYVR